MNYMYKVLNDDEIPPNAGVAIEFNIPQTSKRVDFIISGYGTDSDSEMVIVELKQWETLNEVAGTDALVDTFTGGVNRRVVHPSYQAWSYAQLIRDYNASVQDRRVKLSPCACLHNYIRHENDPIDAEQYEEYIEEAPAYTKGQLPEEYGLADKDLMERFEFRNISQDEVDQAIAIEQICFPPNEACSPKAMKERVAAAPELFLVAVDKATGKIAGFLNGLSTKEYQFRDEFFTDISLYDPEGKHIMLLGLDVLPEYRKQGLAREIVYQYCRRENEKGRDMLHLIMMISNVNEKVNILQKG